MGTERLREITEQRRLKMRSSMLGTFARVLDWGVNDWRQSIQGEKVLQIHGAAEWLELVIMHCMPRNYSESVFQMLASTTGTYI